MAKFLLQTLHIKELCEYTYRLSENALNWHKSIHVASHIYVVYPKSQGCEKYH